MKKAIYILAGLVLIVGAVWFFTGVNDDSQLEDRPFTIMYITGSQIGSYASSYKFANKDIEFEIIAYENYYEYNADLSAMLMAGNAPDVFFLNDVMHIDYAGSGYLEDINEYIENDGSLSRGDFYESVLDAYEVSGILPAMPLTFDTFFMGVRNEFADKTTPRLKDMDYLSVPGMLELYFSIDEREREGYACDMNLLPVTSLVRTSYLDIKNRTVDFVNDEFMDLLEKSRDMAVTTSDGFYYYSLSYQKRFYEELFEDSVFAQFSSYMPSHFLPLKPPYTEYSQPSESDHALVAEGPTDTFVDMVPLATQDGRILVDSYNKAAIYSGSKQKDIAWDFIKYCMSDNTQKADDYLSFKHRIRRDVNERILRETLETYNKSYGHTDTLAQEVEADIQAAMNKLLSPFEQEMFPIYASSIAELDMVLEEDYMKNGADTYETVRNMQQKADTFFIERQ